MRKGKLADYQEWRQCPDSKGGKNENGSFAAPDDCNGRERSAHDHRGETAEGENSEERYRADVCVNIRETDEEHQQRHKCEPATDKSERPRAFVCCRSLVMKAPAFRISG